MGVLDAPGIRAALLGQASGVCDLDATGKVPSSRFPATVLAATRLLAEVRNDSPTTFLPSATTTWAAVDSHPAACAHLHRARGR